MTKKFIRENWGCIGESDIGKFGIGFFLDTDQGLVIASSVLLDLFQSFEDRIEKLEKNDSILQEKLEKRLEDIRSRETNFQLWMNDLVGKIERLDTKIRKGCCDVDPTDAIDNCKHDIKKLEQENKSLRDDVNYLREKILSKEEAQEETKFKQKPEKLSIEQKKHICSAIDKWYREAVSDRIAPDWDTVIEELKFLICDAKVGEFIDD